MQEWNEYPTAPPPLNLLGLPYDALVSLGGIVRFCVGFVLRRRHRQSQEPEGASEFVPKPGFLGQLEGEGLTLEERLASRIMAFVDENTDAVIREDRWKTNIMRAVHAILRKSVSTDALVGDLQQAVRSLQMQFTGDFTPSTLAKYDNTAVAEDDGAVKEDEEEMDKLQMRERIALLEAESASLAEKLKETRWQLKYEREESTTLATALASEIKSIDAADAAAMAAHKISSLAVMEASASAPEATISKPNGINATPCGEAAVSPTRMDLGKPVPTSHPRIATATRLQPTRPAAHARPMSGSARSQPPELAAADKIRDPKLDPASESALSALRSLPTRQAPAPARQIIL